MSQFRDEWKTSNIFKNICQKYSILLLLAPLKNNIQACIFILLYLTPNKTINPRLQLQLASAKIGRDHDRQQDVAPTVTGPTRNQ